MSLEKPPRSCPILSCFLPYLFLVVVGLARTVKEAAVALGGVLSGIGVYALGKVVLDPNIAAIPVPWGKLPASDLVSLISNLIVVPIAFITKNPTFAMGFVSSNFIPTMHNIIKTAVEVSE